MQHFSKKRALLFTSLTHFANDGNFLLFSILIVFFAKLPGVSIAFLGMNAILYNVLYGVISLPVGKFADTGFVIPNEILKYNGRLVRYDEVADAIDKVIKGESKVILNGY